MSSLLQNTSNAPVLVINPSTWNVINTLTKIEVAGISFGKRGIESFNTFDRTYKIMNVTSINTTEYHILVRVSFNGCGSPITTTFLKFFWKTASKYSKFCLEPHPTLFSYYICIYKVKKLYFTRIECGVQLCYR